MLHRLQLDTSCLSLSSQQPPLVELQLLALQNVPITATALSWAGADAGVQTSSGKLVIQVRVKLPVLVTSLELSLHMLRYLLLLDLQQSGLMICTAVPAQTLAYLYADEDATPLSRQTQASSCQKIATW